MHFKPSFTTNFVLYTKVVSLFAVILSTILVSQMSFTNSSGSSVAKVDNHQSNAIEDQNNASQSLAYNPTSIIQPSPLEQNPQESQPVLNPTPIVQNLLSKIESGITKDNQQKPVSNSQDDDHSYENVKTLYTPTKIIPPSQPDTTSPNTILPSVNTKSDLQFLSSNIPQFATEVPVSQVLYLQFEQEITDNVLTKLKFFPTAEFTWQRLSPNAINIFPKRLNRLTTYTFGLQNQAICTLGIELNSCGETISWQYALTFTTSYKEAYRYGTSAQGRPLWSYIFGQTYNDLGKRIMLNGGIHGSEWRSGDLSQLATFLDQNPQEIIGRNKIIIIVPFTNPDGTNANIRFNARGVNLNRNWPADWEFGPVAVRGAFPLSEPETFSLYQLTLQENPNWLISYHAQWPPNGQIFLGDNDNPSTLGFAYWVADRTGYPLGIYPNPDPGASGDVAGDQCVWANSVNINCLIIEATYLQNSDWNKNFPMYLSLLRDF